MKPYLATLPRFAHTAHRGGSALAPENTMAAFEQAVARYRTDVLELDVQPSADGVVMVIHDELLDRTTDGNGPVNALSCAELRTLDAGFHLPGWRGKGARIPTLDEVLRAFPTMHINIELKVASPEFFDAFAALIKQHRAVERVCIGHVNLDESLKLHARLPEACFWFPENAVMEFFQASRGGDPLPERPEFQVLSLPREYMGIQVIDEKLVQDAHRSGRAVHVWTVDEEAQMEELITLGVDSIITDRPDLLREVMTRRGL